MASWNISTISSWTGKVITASEWNNYFGSGGSVVYLKEGYSRFYTSFYSSQSCAASTTVVMVSFTIPSSWKNGNYFLESNTTPNAAQEVATNALRLTNIFVNNIEIRSNNFQSFASSFTFKPIYNVSTYQRLNVNDFVEFKFLQTSTTATFNTTAVIQKVGP